MKGDLSVALKSINEVIKYHVKEHRVNDASDLVAKLLQERKTADILKVAGDFEALGAVSRNLQDFPSAWTYTDFALQLRKFVLNHCSDHPSNIDILVAKSLSSQSILHSLQKDKETTHLEALELFAPMISKHPTIERAPTVVENSPPVIDEQAESSWREYCTDMLKPLRSKLLSALNMPLHNASKLVLVSAIESCKLKVPLRILQNDDSQMQSLAVDLDSYTEHLPQEILFGDFEIIHFGRQPYVETLDSYNPRNNAPISKRRIGYVRFDTQRHDRVISRRHAQIKLSTIHPLFEPEEEQSSWVLRDLESTNGVLVNGVRVRESPLKHGDIVSFGGATSVDYGCAVSTHKRKPVHSVFTYRFVNL